MAGGTWVDQNKKQPGVYINYKSAPSSLATMGERGVVAIARALDWGERGKWYTITDPSDCEQFGHSITDAECLFIRQILLGTNRTQGASKILLWSLGTPEGAAVAASGTLKTSDGQTTGPNVTAVQAGNAQNAWSVEAGKSGNAIVISVKNGDDVVASGFTSITGNAISTSTLNAIESLQGYITFSGNPLPSAVGDTMTMNCQLSGGQNAGAMKATATIGNLTATAKYPGSFGNRLSVVITAGPSSNWIVQTLLDGQAVDSQIVTAISGLVSNDYIDWSGTGAIAANNGVELSGGTNGEANLTNYSDFLDALEVQKFDILIYDGSDATIKSTYAQFVKDLSNNEGAKCQAVVCDYPNPDSECVISVYPQSVTLVDGTVLANEELTWWLGGASAGAKANESLTNAKYTDAVSITPLLNKSQKDSATDGGQLCLFSDDGDIRVLTDINTFRTFRVEKGQAFKKNRVIRTVFGLCNDIYSAFSKYYIGAVDNDEEGRKSLKAEIINILNRYQGIRAVQDVATEDVTVLKGTDSDAVVIEIYVRPVDSVEKIYINITIS